MEEDKKQTITAGLSSETPNIILRLRNTDCEVRLSMHRVVQWRTGDRRSHGRLSNTALMLNKWNDMFLYILAL